jgi:hypothetical protein
MAPFSANVLAFPALELLPEPMLTLSHNANQFAFHLLATWWPLLFQPLKFVGNRFNDSFSFPNEPQ